MYFPRVQSLKFRQKMGCYQCLKKSQNLNVNLVQGLLKQCSHVQIFFCFFAERNLMDSSYISWNKFQDCHLRFILTNHFLVTA